MSDTLSYQQMGTAARGQTHALFAQTMAYVAATAALFALGAWLGRNLTGGIGIVFFIAAFACLIAMRFAARRSQQQLTVGLLGRVRPADRPGRGAHDRLLRQHGPAGAVAGRRGDRAVHRRVRRGRVRHPARPDRDRARQLSGRCWP